MPFATALDPIPHKFKFIPRFIFDLIGLTINRDEVRTPMQWDGTRNAGFSSAEKTWLPIHPNFGKINVENQSLESNSLLNEIRALLRIRREKVALREGSLEILKDLPRGVLGYARSKREGRLVILLNFDQQKKTFYFRSANCVFRLSEEDEIKNETVHLDGYSGVIFGINQVNDLLSYLPRQERKSCN